MADPIGSNDPNAKQLLVDDIFKDNVNNIIPVYLEQEMRKSFIDYAMSVISDRALPDIRDGLKPVHRRILYSMFTKGFTPDKAYRKCATTVGDVLGRFHPHGDGAVYESLVRLAQDFSMRHMLVDGHGNFGSRDGDSAAAYRYTEARLAKISMEMMSDINKETVDFKPNFDEHEMEPVVLPARFPNLLVNGSTGIAVGMATNIPPHNLSEVIDATILYMYNPETTLEELMELLKGPDFPTGGTILGVQGIREAYLTGKGRVVVRSTTEIEEMHGGRYRIVVRDLPYMVNKARLIEKIADLAKEKRIEGISFVRDESDRNEAVRIVIELKREANANVVLNQLYKNTQLQDAFNVNMVALVPDDKGRFEPKMVTVFDCISHYIKHQKDVITRRTKFELNRALNRKHILEGLQIAIDNIDEVIAIIRSSKNEEEAKKNLCARFEFSVKQAQHIVDMRLGRLTGLEREKLANEYAELLKKIAYLESILTDELMLNDVIKEELLEIKRRFTNPRRSQIEPWVDENITDESLIKEETVVITLTHLNYIKRLPVDTYKSQHRGGRGISGIQTKEEDYVQNLLITSTHQTLLFFTNRGRVFKLKAYQIKETGRHARGEAIVNILRLESNERIKTIIPIDSFDDDAYSLVMATRSGLVKKTALVSYANINKNGLIAIALRDEDELIGVQLAKENQEIILVSYKGQSIRFLESDIRTTGRNTQGVRGIRLNAGDSVEGMVLVDEDYSMLVVTLNGYGKRTDFDQYRIQSRGGKGTKTYRPTDKTGYIAGVVAIKNDYDLILVTDSGIVIRVSADEIPILGRVTQGVTLMRTGEGTVVDLAVSPHEEEEEEDLIDSVEE